MSELLNGFTQQEWDATDWVVGEGFYQFVEDDDADGDHELWVYHRSGAIERAVAPADWFEDEAWQGEYLARVCEAEDWDPSDVVLTAVNG